MLLVQVGSGKVRARPTTVYQAEHVVIGWLTTDARPLGTSIGRQVTATETFANESGEPVYYVVYLRPTGFVIVPADDLVEPIIGFTDNGTYDGSPENPLGALVGHDLNGRVASVRATASGQATMLVISESQKKWHRFISLGETAAGSLTFLNLSSASDVRVAPLVQSKWSQGDVCSQYCFNYYTPYHYYCGCVATAMAQLMRYHQYPLTGIGVHDFTIKVQGSARAVRTRGGDGLGGPYDWRDMVLVPNCQTTDRQRQAIGALCHDASISVDADYGPDSTSGDVLMAKEALVTIFQYSHAVNGYDDQGNVGPGLLDMINPNLDYGSPVILGLSHEGRGHAVVCDGYGYTASTLYHHLNMGWGGADDTWYNLPNVEAHYTYTSVVACLYNVFTSGTGEIISGRVTDPLGTPISGVTMTAQGSGGPYTATTNAEGIYALAKIPSASRYTLSAAKEGYRFTDQVVRTGTSRDWLNRSGNRWQIDFVAAIAGDCDGDGDVDSADFAVFARAWLSEPGDVGWNPCCDVSVPADYFIDPADLAVFLDNWLAGTQ